LPSRQHVAPRHSSARRHVNHWTGACPHRGALWSFPCHPPSPPPNHQAPGGAGVGGENDLPGAARKAARTRRAATKRKSRAAACGTPGRVQKGEPANPATDGRPIKNAAAHCAAPLFSSARRLIRRDGGLRAGSRSRTCVTVRYLPRLTLEACGEFGIDDDVIEELVP